MFWRFCFSTLLPMVGSIWTLLGLVRYLIGVIFWSIGVSWNCLNLVLTYYADRCKKLKKVKSGSVEVKTSNNRLQLVFSFDGKCHYLSLGLTDTPYNRKQAQDRAFEIQRDIEYGQFDVNDLAKYKAEGSANESEPVAPVQQTPELMEI